MKKIVILAFSGLLTTAASLCAQNTSPWPQNGNVGIGTTNPSAALDIENGAMKVGIGTSQSSQWALFGGGSDGHFVATYPSLGAWNYNGIVQAGDEGIIYSSGSVGTGALVIAPWADATSGLRMDSSGDVGIYTASNFSGSSAASASALSVTNATPNSGFITKIGYTNIGISSILPATDTSAKAAYYSYVSNGIATETGLYIDGVAAGNNYGIYSPVAGLQSYFNGNVGIGTTSPGKPLDVAGTIRTSASGGDTGGIVYPDGTQQTTAWTGVLCGGDYAEAVNASGDRKHYEPGDVLVLGSDADGEVEKSSEPYSSMVTGIFATKPGVIGRRESLSKSAQEIPMAMVGIVPTKVSAENGPIHRGDLLVTSSKPGYAMKGTDRNRMLGAVIGKAVGNLDTGTGVIEVVVTLQ